VNITAKKMNGFQNWHEMEKQNPPYSCPQTVVQRVAADLPASCLLHWIDFFLFVFASSVHGLDSRCFEQIRSFFVECSPV
jgi:hypothetical protein